MAFIQFLCVEQDMARGLREEFPDVPILGGTYDPGMANLREVPANSGRNPPTEKEDVELFGVHTRSRSEAGSDNPRPSACQE